MIVFSVTFLQSSQSILKKQRNVRIEGNDKIFCGRTKSKKVYVLEESHL